MSWIIFDPWPKFDVQKKPQVVKSWLTATGAAGVKKFKAGMRGSHSGVKYPNLPRQSSAPGEYPATQSGGLIATIRSKSRLNSAKYANLQGEVTIGSNQPYSAYLRQGTRKMARRKMSDDALKEGGPEAEAKIEGWVKWTRSR